MQLPVLALLIATAATLPCARGFGIVSASGGVFIEDGRRARFAGTNALSLAQFGDDFMRADVLSRMARANLTLLRLWAFNDGELCAPAPRQNFLQCWDAATARVEANETALALRLDAALAAAAQAGVHVLLSLTNNWPSYGGIATYLQWRAAAAAAGVAPALSAPLRHDDFYVDATMRGWFRAWATGLAARVNTVTGVAYRDDPCIFAWELGNELACTNSSAAAPCVVNGSSPAMRAWVTEMSAAIKAVDGNHMVAVGDEGFYGAGDVDCPRAQWWCNGSAMW
jgi:mannan endo-1,4-beta-mannosidase